MFEKIRLFADNSQLPPYDNPFFIYGELKGWKQ